MPRYTFKCERCETSVEAVVPWPYTGKEPECDRCHRPMERDFVADVKSASLNMAGARKIDGYPYVSRTFPFGSPLARHYGPSKFNIIENRQHEARMRAYHKYCGDEKITEDLKPVRFGESNAVFGGAGDEAAAERVLADRVKKKAAQNRRSAT